MITAVIPGQANRLAPTDASQEVPEIVQKACQLKERGILALSEWEDMSAEHQSLVRESLAERALSLVFKPESLIKPACMAAMLSEFADYGVGIWPTARQDYEFQFPCEELRIGSTEEVSFMVRNVKNLNEARRALRIFLKSITEQELHVM